MIAESIDAEAIWADIATATELFAVDPAGLGGVVLRAPPGPQRDRVLAWIRSVFADELPMLRMPMHISEDRLLGGLALADTLRAGRLVAERGLLAQADGGVVVGAMAERLSTNVTAHLASALDRRELAIERDGITATLPCRIAFVALDEGIGDERVPAQLSERLAFQLDLSRLEPRSEPTSQPSRERVARASALLASVTVDDAWVETLCEAASALGVASLRASIASVAAARAHAALAGRARVEEADAALAARLVLGWRATIAPTMPAETPPPPPPSAEEQSDAPAPQQSKERDDAPDETPPEPTSGDEARDVVLEAAKSGIPAGLLETLSLARAARSAPKSAGRAGALRASTTGGRPAGAIAGSPEAGKRLNLVETLRAAAPWQRMRRRERAGATEESAQRVEVRRADFRVTRYVQRTETTVIFCVDASGSAALQRLAEAKGAVERVLVDCYARRDHVALIAFRGTEASLLLPPTRSLARVRRCLAELAGGGTTPLAIGIDAALTLARDAQRRGKSPILVLMTDGRANVGRGARQGVALAIEDARASAREVRGASIRALFLDTSPRPRAEARALAAEMGARYVPLPYVDASEISRQVRSVAESST